MLLDINYERLEKQFIDVYHKYGNKFFEDGNTARL